MNVLHIASWYPHSRDPFDGDFVQRHVKALSYCMPVHVIHVVQKFHLLKDVEASVEHHEDEQLFSTVYFPGLPNVRNKTIQKLLFARRYHKTMRLAVEKYIQQHGKPDIIHVHVPVKAGYAALRMKRMLNIPFVVTEHSSAYFSHAENNYFSGSSYFRFITKQSFEQAAVVSSVSQWLLIRLKELFAIYSTRVIRNAVDTSLFYPVARSSATKKFIHVSMMLPLKNVEGIIEALYLIEQQKQDWEMVFVGDAPDALKEKAKGLGSKVQWTGTLSYAAVAQQMQQADALVHFSHYENLPCVVNEALCCGLPIIASRVGGIDELVNESNGILVNSNDSNALAKAMLRFLNGPQQFNKNDISSNATAQFSYETVGKSLLNMYRQIVNAV